MRLPDKKLHFCTAGIPLSAPDRSSEKGVSHLVTLGLDGMELEFVRGVNLSSEKAKAVGKTAKEHHLVLTAHAPYYINLNAVEKAKWHASIGRIVLTAVRAAEAGAYSICFHPGYYLGQEPEKAYGKIREALGLVNKALDEKGIDIWVRPETTGKASQFGSLKELIRLSQDCERMLPCVDFAHLHARSAGRYNSPGDFRETLTLLEKGLGRKALDEMHIHMSGIAYSEKGERNHLILEESDLKWRELLAVLKEFRVNGVVISESPNIERDALLMKRTYCRF